MNAHLEADYQNAAAALLLANTPLFLVRKLLSDSAVAKLAHEATEAEIMSELIASAKREPADFLEGVRPYVYLVALSLKSNVSLIKQAINIDTPYAPWFKYIANYLATSAIPTTRTSISISPRPPRLTTGNRITSPSHIHTGVATLKISGGR